MHKVTVERVIAEISENLDQKLLPQPPFMMPPNVLMGRAEVISLNPKIYLNMIFNSKVGLEVLPHQYATLTWLFIDWAWITLWKQQSVVPLIWLTFSETRKDYSVLAVQPTEKDTWLVSVCSFTIFSKLNIGTLYSIYLSYALVRLQFLDLFRMLYSCIWGKVS